jgi:hypothetical protein
VHAFTSTTEPVQAIAVFGQSPSIFDHEFSWIWYGGFNSIEARTTSTIATSITASTTATITSTTLFNDDAIRCPSSREIAVRESRT